MLAIDKAKIFSVKVSHTALLHFRAFLDSYFNDYTTQICSKLTRVACVGLRHCQLSSMKPKNFSYPHLGPALVLDCGLPVVDRDLPHLSVDFKEDFPLASLLGQRTNG